MIDIENLKAQVGAKLEKARKDKGLSQEEVAKLLGLTKVGYGALERGKNLIGLQHLIMLSVILEKPITSLLPDYAVSESEREDALLDPLLQEFISLWPEIPPAGRPLLLQFMKQLLDLRRASRQRT